MNINWTVRLKNPVFWVQVAGAVVMTALTYNSLQPADMTTWQGVGQLLVGILTNPFLLVSCLWSVWSAVNDPTTSGVKDSASALTYEAPKKEEEV